MMVEEANPVYEPLETINISDDSEIDKGLHGVKLILATNVTNEGEVELKASIATAQPSETQTAINVGTPIAGKEDFKALLSDEDKAVGNQFKNIYNEYDSTMSLRARGTVPSGIEILNMLRRHGKLRDAKYKPIIDAVRKNYNNEYGMYNDNDTNWFNVYAAKNAYNKFVKYSPLFFAREQAFLLSGKNDMGIINGVGNAGTLAMGVAGSAKAAVENLAKRNTWTEFSNIINNAITTLGNINITKYLKPNQTAINFIHESVESEADDNDPKVAKVQNLIRQIYSRLISYFENNEAVDDKNFTENDDNNTPETDENKSMRRKQVEEIIARCMNSGVSVFQAGGVLLISPILVVAGLARLGEGAFNGIIFKSGNVNSEGSQTMSIGLSDKWKGQQDQIAATNQGRKHSALNAIMKFILDNEEKLGIRFKLALANLWSSINTGFDSAIEWDCSPKDITFAITKNNSNENEINVQEAENVGANSDGRIISTIRSENSKYNLKDKLNDYTIYITNVTKDDITPVVSLSKYCPLNCIAKLAKGSSRILNVITENLTKVTVLGNGAPHWEDSFINYTNYEYNGRPEIFIYALMKRRFSGYTNKISDTFSKGYDGLKGIGKGIGTSILNSARTMRNRVSDFYKNRIKTRKNSVENVDANVQELNSAFIGGKRNKHSKRVAKNKQNKRKTHRH